MIAAVKKVLAHSFVFALLFSSVRLCNAGEQPEVNGSTPPSASVTLRVEVLEVTKTDFPPPLDCGAGEMCVQFNSWYKYRARVVKVLSGEWKMPEIEFANLQHGQYIDKFVADCYVVLRPAGSAFQSKIAVPFVAVKLLSPRSKGDEEAILALREGN